MLSYLVGYFVSANSDAFNAARTFIVKSSVVNSELGGNVDVRLAPFGYELEFAGSWGAATFGCNVKGSSGQGKVLVTLSKAGQEWRVETATLVSKGKSVALSEP
jgi:hypothetical protein